MRTQGHGVKAGYVIAIDTAHNAAGDKGEDKTVSEDDGARTKGGHDAMLELVEEIGGVHERQGEPSNGVLGEELIDVAANKIRTTQAAGLHREAFRLKPFLEECDLGGATRTVHAFNDDQSAVEIAGIEADK